MNHKALYDRRRNRSLVVAPASASTWVVAFSRQLIPGALFKSKDAAVDYAASLATAAGFRHRNVKILGNA